jgi:tetratricopeptide (TPR) repeat protein
MADVPGLYTFTHGLMRETLYSDLSTAQRIAAHAAVGDALEAVYGEDIEPHLAEVAHHYVAAAPSGYAEKAVDYATRAGERAMRLLAYEDAERLFESALGALALSEDAEPARGAALLLALGRARIRTGSAAARDTLFASAEAARRLELPELLAHAALGFRAFARVPGVVDDEVVALLEEALECLDQEDSDLCARLLVRLAVQLYDDIGAAGRRRELAEEAIAIARRLGDRSTLAYVLNNAQLATWSPDTREEELAWSDEVIALAEKTGDLDLIATTRSRRIDLLLELDDFPGADVELEALARVVTEIPETRARAHLAAQRSRRYAIEGRLADAEALSREAEELAARVGDSAMAIVSAGQRITLAWTRGQLEEVESTVQKLAAAAPGMPIFRGVLAQLYVHGGREAEARGEYENLRADDFAGIPRNGSFLHALSVLAEVAWHLGDEAGGRALYDLLLPFAKRNVISIQSAYAGPVSRYLALLATTCGEHDAAREHLSSAAAAAERVGARALVAMLQLDEARMLLRDDERASALEACRQAAAMADAIDADGLRERAEALRDEIGGEATPPVAAPSAPAAPAAPAAGSIKREGDVWVFDYGENVTRVRASKGLHYLARLLANPGIEVHAIELVAGGEGGHDTQAPAALDAGLEIQSGPDSAGPVLDASAKASYRERLEDLRVEIEEAESFNDPERAARAREEMDFIARELAGAIGLGGRDRQAGSNVERARVNATRAIRGAIKRILDYDENLGHELDATVKTGTFCAYEPDPRRPIKWTVEDG